jgi:hypothetical protein
MQYNTCSPLDVHPVNMLPLLRLRLHKPVLQPESVMCIMSVMRIISVMRIKSVIRIMSVSVQCISTVYQ